MGLLDRLFGAGMIRDPVRGTAEVVSCSDHRGRAELEKCRLQLVVTAEDVPATAVEQQALVHRSRWPAPGMTLPATIDRANPSNVRIEWDEVPDERARAQQRAERKAIPGRAARRRPGARPKDRFDERVRRLEQLAKLHAAGALTDAEFAEQKRKLFGG
jgi:hypothetical protein